MYKIKDTVYADGGSLLLGNGRRGFQLLGSPEDFTESAIVLSDMRIDGTMLVCDNGRLRWPVPEHPSYASLKRWAVGLRYSNDDQIAVMLNKDDSEEDALMFRKMQEWREWSSTLARKIMEVISASQSADESH